MTVAVCLQTCDRADLTARTVESFAAFNDLSRFQLLHADDASSDGRNRAIAERFGFQTVVRTRNRQGVTAVRTRLIAAAARRKAAWVLLLENDIETLRPFPWALFEFARQNEYVYCLRLYGRFKDAARQEPCLTTHKRRGHTPVLWRPFKGAPEASQIGDIHWSAQPAVTRTRELLEHHRTGDEPSGWTVRVKKNVMAHIGVDRTPGRLV